MEMYHDAVNHTLGPESKRGREMEALVESYISETKAEMGPDFSEKAGRLPRVPEDFSTMADPDPEIAPDEEFKDDDITSHAHGELDQHREMREFMRLASWEMPLLSNLAVPFEAPQATTPLRWRYTTYFGTPHPAANKVVLTFTPSSLPDLTPPQVANLIKLAGSRFNPHTNTVKMSCESYPSQAQNKRYLGDILAKLIKEAKQGEQLDDIPYDFRHAREKKNLRFPKEWRITRERRSELDQKRGKPGQLATGESTGDIVDGIKMIEASRHEAANEMQKQLATQAAMTKAGPAVKGRAR
ncbi:hypothetical protein CAC42_1913 [Sphaceloma murrayae]|uniref:Small ribosomal subunit protein mS35 mitochondrial conserved domain-containing protein n=1 Tax=Sphaceloma murrayae TaxID=2082308 RepID=A0A2K1QVT2_9PEZI|nr:hypothetical protein CAC42_1913 [Sphaceloma murrayae]